MWNFYMKKIKLKYRLKTVSCISGYPWMLTYKKHLYFNLNIDGLVENKINN